MSNILIINDILMVETVCNDSALQQSSSTMRYWKVANIVGAGIIQFSDVATFFDGLCNSLWTNILYNGATYNGVRCRRRFPANLDSWQMDNSNAGNGTAGAVGLPSQACGLFKMVGNTLGKHGRGRVYTPFPSATDNVTSGLPSAGYQAGLAALATQLVSSQAVTVGATTATLIPGLWDPVAAAFTSVNQFTTEAAWATQKRRGAFGRFNRPPF